MLTPIPEGRVMGSLQLFTGKFTGKLPLSLPPHTEFQLDLQTLPAAQLPRRYSVLDEPVETIDGQLAARQMPAGQAGRNPGTPAGDPDTPWGQITGPGTPDACEIPDSDDSDADSFTSAWSRQSGSQIPSPGITLQLPVRMSPRHPPRVVPY